MNDVHYRPAWWVPGAHARTIWGKLVRRIPVVATRREQWDTPDGDVIDIERLDAPADRPRLVLLHGLEGTVRSHYVQGTLAEVARRGWSADLVLFRSCGGSLNRARRFYHSGETGDLAFALERIMGEFPDTPLVMAGFSLGGNVLLKYLGERGDAVPAAIRAAVAVSVPFDLDRGADHIDRGFARVYQASFMKSLKRKAYAKLEQYPNLYDRARLDAVRSIRDFDELVTAPLHGFADATDYYTQSSALRFLGGIRRPTLLLSAVDDPFLPPAVLDDVRAVGRVNPALTIEFVPEGGHVGFISGTVPWRPIYYAERRVAGFLSHALRGPEALSA
jgi:predicted alpha/beta-fold hydrolase